MNTRTRIAVILGIVLFALGLAIRTLANAEGPQLLLFIVTCLAVGVVAARVRRAFVITFVLAVIYALLNTLVTSPKTFDEASNPSVLLAFIVIGLLVPALAGALLSALGGLVGKLVFKGKAKTARAT